MSSVNDLLYPTSYVKEGNDVPVWYEFLLNPDYLDEHLSKSSPEPSACDLIKDFFFQHQKGTNDANQSLPETEKQRKQAIKRLALQAAAILQWDLTIFEKQLPMPIRYQLLTDFFKTCGTAMPPAPQNGLANAIENMHDHALSSLILYCRWAGHAVVEATFIQKPGGRSTPTVPQSIPYQANAQQRCDEQRDMIVNLLKEQIIHIVQWLETVLHNVKRSIYMPSSKSIRNNKLCKPNVDPADDIFVTCEELHAQICFDLGSLHFTHGYYEKAGEMFGHVREWLKKLPDKRCSFCCIDENVLAGYHSACQMVTIESNPGSSTIQAPHDATPYQRIEACMKRRDFKEITDIIINDGTKRELSTSYLEKISEKVQQDNDATMGDVKFDIKWSCAVRRAMVGHQQPVYLWSYDMSLTKLQRVVGFIRQLKATFNQNECENVGMFLSTLTNNIAKPSLAQKFLKIDVVRQLIDEDDYTSLLLKMKSSVKAKENLISTSSSSNLDSFFKAQQSENGRIALLERTLIRATGPSEIKETINQLHSLVPGRRVANHCSFFTLPDSYATVVNNLKLEPATHDFVHIALAKILHCMKDREFSSAKSLLYYLQKTTSNEKKVMRIVSNELLYLELLQLFNDSNLNYGDAEECSELRAQLTEDVGNCRQLLINHCEKKNFFVPYYILELSVAMLLNLEDLSFFKNVSRSLSSEVAPCLRFTCLLSAVRSTINDRTNDSRKAVNEMWSAFTGIFATVPPLMQSSNTGGKYNKKVEILRNCLPPNAIIARPALIKFIGLIKNINFLQIILSMLVHLHRLCRTDIVSDISAPDAFTNKISWPSSLDGSPVSTACVTLALRETLTHCLILQPKNKSWLRTQGDLHYAFNSLNSALRCYLLLGAFETDFFSGADHPSPYENEQVIKRMIKCCMLLQKYTEAAVLCQFLNDIDYATAFKALQESRKRCDASELHYTEHIWDIQILEHAAHHHREAGEVGKKNIALSAVSRPQLNHNNIPAVGSRNRALLKTRFLRTMALQYLC